MSELFLNAVNMSISASWLILAVLACRVVLRKAPKWVNVLLWGVVAARLLFPFSIESALSLIPSAETVSPGIMTDAVPAIDTGIPAINNAVNPVIGQTFAPSPVTSASPLQIWIPVLAAVWAAGTALLLAYTAVSYWRLRGKVDTAVRFRDNIFQSENVSSPFVLGVIRPRIYLPFTMDGQDMVHVVAHERAHLRRGDHWWKPLGFLLLTVHWFNPLMWLAYVLLCRDIELACDEKVIRELDNEQRADYTQALLNCSAGRRIPAACPLAFGEAGVKERVKSVMNYKKPAFWIVVVAVAACVAVAVCFLTNPEKNEPDEPDGPPLYTDQETDRPDGLPPLYPHRYGVVAVIYESAIYDFSMVAQENTPFYAVTEGMGLMSQGEYTPGDEWTDLGVLEETRLTKENFDDLFRGPDDWYTGDTAATVRKNNANAWMLVYEDILYYVLQQKNGDVYLAFGYYDYGEKDDPASDDTSIRWLFKLAVDPDDSVPGTPGGVESRPVESGPPAEETGPVTPTGAPTEVLSLNADLLSELGMSYLQLSEKYGGVLGGFENTWNFGGYGRYAWKIVGHEWDYTVFEDMTTAGGCNWIDGVSPEELFSGVSYPISFEDLENRYGFIPLSISDEPTLSDLYWSEFRLPMYDNVTYIVGTWEYGLIDTNTSGVLSLNVDCREARPLIVE